MRPIRGPRPMPRGARPSGARPTTANPIRMKKGGKVKGYKDGGCVMGNRGVRNTKMV